MLLEKLDHDVEGIENRIYEALETADVRDVDAQLISHDQNLEEAVYRVTIRLRGGDFRTIFAEVTNSGDVEIYDRVG